MRFVFEEWCTNCSDNDDDDEDEEEDDNDDHRNDNSRDDKTLMSTCQTPRPTVFACFQLFLMRTVLFYHLGIIEYATIMSGNWWDFSPPWFRIVQN